MARGTTRACFGMAVDALERLAQDCPPVLVHCHAGRSRSAVVVAAYLMRVRRIGPAEAVAAVAAVRDVAVTPALVRLLG